MLTTSPTTTPFAQPALDQLRAQLQGAVHVPGEAGYDDARRAWNLAISQHPAIIVAAQRPADVAAAVRFAQAQGLGVAVQSTGHGVVRPADGALLILTAPMAAVRVDAAAQTAWVEAGALWGAVLEKAQAVGLAPLLGSSPGVGVVGYTLGGGLGWLARKYGLAADSVRAFEGVTAEGELRRASAAENADLFWALRGGGGAFAIVTGLEIQLYPVTTVVGGNLIYPIELAREVITRYRAWIASAPDELTSSVVIMNFPPVPDVPEFLRGRSAVIVRGLYCGPVAEGEALLRYWRDWRAPLADLFRTMPFAEVATVSNDPRDPLPGYSSGAWLRELSDDAITALIEYGVARPGVPGVVFAEVRHIGGAVARADRRASAFGGRDAELLLSVIGVTPTAEARRQVAAHVAQLKRAMSASLTGSVYMNFLDGDESRARTADAYRPEDYQRLQRLKIQYDPHNRLSFSFNIPPAANS